MSDYFLLSGRISSGLVISAGTTLAVGPGGVAIDTTVKDGGFETVFSGGVTSATTVRAGGSELVSNGGTAVATALKDAGYLGVGSGGTAISAAVSGGVTMVVSAGGTALATSAGAAAAVFVTSEVQAGQVASGLVIGSRTILEVASGGLAISTTIAQGGVETVLSGGTASATLVSSSGAFTVLAGGSATDTAVNVGAKAAITVAVGSGAVSSGLVADAVTSVYILSGGITRDTIIVSGGSEVVSSGGTEIGTVVRAGGFDILSGTAEAPVISGFVRVEGGVVSGALVADSGGLAADEGGSVLSDTTITGEGVVVLADGSAASGGITFAGDATLAIEGSTMPFAVLSHFDAGNRLDLIGVPFVSGGTARFGDGALVVSEGGQTAVLQLAGDYAGARFTTAPDGFETGDDNGTLVTVGEVPCFAAGTLIATARGPVAVERLALGDHMLTAEGGTAPIVWLGARVVDCIDHPEPAKVWPVAIRAHAFGPGRPARDLFLSPDHAVFAEGVLIPVKHLIDGIMIAQVAVTAVSYHHVELPRHAVIMAEGLPVESYLDTGDRNAFARPEEKSETHAAFGSERADIALVAEALGYAPLRVTGPEVDRVRAALATRAGSESDIFASFSKRARSPSSLAPSHTRRPRRPVRRSFFVKGNPKAYSLWCALPSSRLHD
jgi:collagen type I/II/III/V/XI/XXIV/XXVII alpha